MIVISGDLGEKWVSIDVSHPEFGSFSHRFDDVVGIPEELLVAATLANDHQLTIPTAVSSLELRDTGVEWTENILRSFAGLKAAVIRHLCGDRLLNHASLSWLRHRLFAVEVAEDSEGREICNGWDSKSAASIDESKIAMTLDAFLRFKGEMAGVSGMVTIRNSRVEEAINATSTALMWHHRLLNECGMAQGCDTRIFHDVWKKAKSIEIELAKYASDEDMLEAAVAALLERTFILLSIKPRDNPDAGELVAFVLFGPDRHDFEKVLAYRDAQTHRITDGLKAFCAFFESSTSMQMKDAILEGLLASLKSILSTSGKFEFAMTDRTEVENFLFIWRRIVEILAKEITLVAVEGRGEEDSATCYALRCLQAILFHLDDKCIRKLSKQKFLDVLAELLNSGDHRMRSAVVCMIDAIISDLLQIKHEESMQVLDSLTSILISRIRLATTRSSHPKHKFESNGDDFVILSNPVTISSSEDCFIIRVDANGYFSLSFWLWLPDTSINGNILVLEGELNSQRSLLSFDITDGKFNLMFANRIKINTDVGASAERWQHVTFSVDEIAGSVNLIVDGLTCSTSLATPTLALYSKLYLGHADPTLSLGRFVNCSIADLQLRSSHDGRLHHSQPSQASIINRFERCKVRLSCDKECFKDLSFGIAPMLYSGQYSNCVFGLSAGTIGVHYSSELASFVMRSGEISENSDVPSHNFPYFGSGFSMELDIRSCGKLILTAQENGRPEKYVFEHQSSLPSLKGTLVGIASEDIASIRYEARDEVDRLLFWDMGLDRFGYPAAFSSESPSSPSDVIASLGCLSKLPFDKMSREQKLVARDELSALCSESSSVLVRLAAARYLAHLEAAAWSE